MDTVWANMQLPGATENTEIHVESRVWRKIGGDKHMKEHCQPWDEWINTTTVAKFRAIWPKGCQTEEEQQAVTTVSNVVCADARVSLATPLLMKYNYRRISKRSSSQGQQLGSLGNSEESFRLVLPSGAHTEIRRGRDGRWTMRSCYFEKNIATRNVPFWQRYRKMVQSLRTRYLQAPGSPNSQINDPYIKPDSMETGIEFLSSDNWGLEATNPPDPWNYLPSPWPQPPSLPVARPGPNVLRPRPFGGTTS